MVNGIKIINLYGNDILKNNLEGLQIQHKYEGVFANSLLLDKLKVLGLKISTKNTTRDIISVEFKFPYVPQETAEDNKKIEEIKDIIKSVRQQIKDLKSQKKLVDKEGKLKIQEKIETFQNDIEDLKDSKANLEVKKANDKLSSNDVRDKLYQDGFTLDFYKNKKATGEVVIDETIKFKFWFRSPSKSRVGDVVFINEKLFDKIKSWQRMGLELPENGDVKLVEMAAYESLTSSNIESTIVIDPNNILVVDDIKSFFNTKCAIVSTDENGHCQVDYKMDTVSNTLFDGQALLDDELFTGAYSDSHFMLLRHHFFKDCGFRTHIKKFMQDWCVDNGKDYDTFEVKDRYGNMIRVKDILMITTENAMKWEKFDDIGAKFDYWKQKVNEDNNVFGVCKVDHESKYGDKQRLSYQMINTLDVYIDGIKELAADTIQFVNAMKDNNDLFLDFLKIDASFNNANEMVI